MPGLIDNYIRKQAREMKSVFLSVYVWKEVN